VLLTGLISYFHFTTSPSLGHVHLILMQFYLVPILIGAIQFGVIGGLGTAIVISIIVAPHIIFQWMGSAQYHFLGYLQIVIFNAVGYLTGLKVQLERKTREHLIHTAAELTQTLNLVEKQAGEMSELEEQLRHSERLSVIGELMASLAHELRNPLASIRGSVEILNKELDERERRGEFFQILVNETERMSAVVENYLALARRSKGHDVEYDAVDIVRSSCLLLTSRARKDLITIQYTLPEQTAMVWGNPNDLRQVMVNLMLNAIQAMQGPGKITIKATLPTQEGVGKMDQPPDIQNLEVTLLDEGPGIADDELQMIFRPFYSTKIQGTGLGLSIVKRIVDSRQWQISVASVAAGGALFTLTLPVNSHTFAQGTV